MRIQHNIPALNAYRNYNNNASALSKNLEKLSSGYRINRAGDDAAGLAISEKMRAQITGLDAAQKNVKDGISLVKTAEGAMQEVQDMLNRMTYLATQSANGTYDNEVDRKNLQKEVNELCTEINRIADSTNFNGIKLLDGSLGVNEDSAITNVQVNQYQKASTDLEAFNVRYVANRPDHASTANASFVIDFNDFKISTTASGIASGSHKITVKVGDTDISVTMSGTSVTASAVVAKLVQSAGKSLASATTDPTLNSLGTAVGSHVKIGGNTYQMTGSGTKLTFTQVNVMEKGAERVNPDFSVGITVSAAKGYNASYNINDQVTVTKQGIADGGKQQAKVEIGIDFSKLKDGDKLTVGSTTYTFKIGTDSNVASGTANVIDLSKTFTTEEDMKSKSLQQQAMVEITKAMASNANWSVGNAGIVGNSGTLTFMSTGSHASTTVGDLTTQEKVMNQFKTSADEKSASTTFDFDATKLQIGDTITVGDVTYEFTADGKTSVEGRVGINIGTTGVTESQASSIMAKLKAAIETDKFVGTGASAKFSVTYDADKKTMTIEAQDNGNTTGISENANAVRVSVGGSGLTLQIGDTAESFNKLNVAIDDMHVDALGLSGIDISTQGGAEEAIEKIKSAINTVSATRGTLGANQNRLEHTTNNLSIMKENITDAESAIRDTDVADEMTKYTKNNILLQSAQAMLAQANQLPQGVLQLLG